MALVFGVNLLNGIPLLRWLTRASSLYIKTIVADKGSLSRSQAYIKKKENPGKDTELHQNKTNPDQTTLLINSGSGDGSLMFKINYEIIKRQTFKKELIY